MSKVMPQELGGCRVVLDPLTTTTKATLHFDVEEHPRMGVFSWRR